MKIPNPNDIFHVHTYRCGHAENVPDEAYVKETIRLGADGIWFTDHAPFPGDPFRGRMKHGGLDEYLDAMERLKDKYGDYVHAGLEIEYFPSYDASGYYDRLAGDGRIDVLLLGQHMAEDGRNPGTYTFSWDKGRLGEWEYTALGDAVCAGIRSGYFGAVAHPDRIFRRRKAWDESMGEVSERIIEAAKERRVPLEINMHSVAVKHHYWTEFWDMVPECTPVITGLDAHSLEELSRRYTRQRSFREKRYNSTVFR